MGKDFSHISDDGQPAMVDVSGKVATARSATASCRVVFPDELASTLRDQDLHTAKGPVLATAIIAGTQAVKRTHELIPFCHPLPIDGCRFTIEWCGHGELEIRCTVTTVHRTGVEMEALTGATLAALTVYDMCKALSHEIIIGPARLLAKSGGRREVGG